MDTYHWDILVTYHWDIVGCFIWDLFETWYRRTDGTPSLRLLETSSGHTIKKSWKLTTKTSWRRSTETSLSVSFETYLRSCWDVQRDVIMTSPRRLVAGWVLFIWYSIYGQGFSVIPFFLLRISNKICYWVLIQTTDDIINFKIYLWSSSKALVDR